jgi:trimethylamine:corrinoid methyltransferase-like protein
MMCRMPRAAMFVNTLPRYEILSEDAMAVLDRGWRRLMTEIGIEFLLDESVEVFRAAGQRVEDGNRVYLDPEFVLEQVAKAPREFDVQARNPEKTIHVGGQHMAFASVYGCPFVRDGDVRREATMDDSRTSSGSRRPSRSSTRPAARSASPTTARWTRATSTWSTRCRPCRTSRTWAR